MTLQELKRGSETIQKYDYGYGQIDSNGNLDATKNNGQLAKVESHIGTDKQWTQKFKYDSIGRLSESAEYKGTNNALTYKQKFDYDKFGNLYRKASSNPTTGQENPIAFETIEDADLDKTTNRFTSGTGTTYNNAGQVITDNKFRDMTFGNDANGRMVKVSKGNVPDAQTVYDATGNRVATKVNDVWQFVIYDAFGRLVAEYGGLSSDEGGVKYYLQDWQGSPRAVLNAAGYIQSRTDYQAFGGEITSGIGLRTTTQGFGGGINTRQGYGLTEKDDGSGLNHTWFRKLENQAGRWTSPDPYNGSMSLGNPQSFNRYSYVSNQPTNYVDPSGLLRIQQCTRDWYIDSSGNIHYSSWRCQTIYDDGGHSGLGGDNGNASTTRINKKVLNECVKNLFGENVARWFNFTEATSGKSGFITINPFVDNQNFAINVTDYNNEEIEKNKVEVFSYNNSRFPGEPEQFLLGQVTAGYFGMYATQSFGSQSHNTAYLSNQLKGFALAFNQIVLIGLLLQKATGVNNVGLLACVSNKNGIDFSD